MAAPNAKPTSTPEWASTADTVLPWQASTAYLAGDLATNGANVYEVVTAGTSAGSGGPTGTGSAITDNTITWRYLGKAGTAGGITEPSPGRKQTGWLAGEKPPHGYFNWLSNLAYLWTKFLDTFNQYLQIWQNAAVFEGPPAWAPSTAYVVGEYVLNSGKVYVCAVAGTSAGSGGPTGTGTGITDGTVTWDYSQLPFDVEVPARVRAGLEATQSSTNAAAITATGNGTGAGVAGTGGGSNGAGATFTGGATNGAGVVAQGTGTGAGGVFTGGASNGAGLTATAGGTNADGINATGVGVGSGILATGGASSGGTGVTGVGGATNGRGVSGTGTGTGPGGIFTSPANGVEGSTTSSTTGKGVSGSATSGTGTAGVYAEHQGAGAALIAISSQGVAGEFTRGSGRGAINIVPAAGDPSSPEDGDIWYNSTTNELKVRINGATLTFTVA